MFNQGMKSPEQGRVKESSWVPLSSTHSFHQCLRETPVSQVLRESQPCPNSSRQLFRQMRNGRTLTQRDELGEEVPGRGPD